MACGEFPTMMGMTEGADAQAHVELACLCGLQESLAILAQLGEPPRLLGHQFNRRVGRCGIGGDRPTLTR